MVSNRELARLDFTPWEADNPVPSVELMNAIYVSSQVARAIMSKTRDELVAIHMDSSNAEVVDEMIPWLAKTGEILKELAGMVETANLRVLASMVAAYEGLKGQAG